MTLMDLYKEVISRLGEGTSPQFEARTSKNAPILWIDLYNGTNRYFCFRGNVLTCVYCLGLKWGWIDVIAMDGNISVQCEEGLDYQDAIYGLRNGNPSLFGNNLVC